jgi:hypothetical protein
VHGPVWSEVAAARGWQREHTELVLSALAAAGWVTFTAVPRSLAPGPRATAQASAAVPR